eukprot:TRINITY_DN2428_c1_g1_i1.p1 TRINITY_DN2428_c1_g1~~TRINITY_DN2428_c1_g1_i1.p1  ORF type:complete len:305 (+),score=24.70 TRINITY_DN2428_c1_g1_i1:69-983(+)
MTEKLATDRRAGLWASCRELDLEGQINATPATAVISIMAVVTLITSIVLNDHVLWTVDHRAVFVIGSYVIFSSYYMIYYFLEKYSSSFRGISPEKRFYTISNLIKSGMLAAITPFSIQGLYNIIYLDLWETIKIRNLGCLYAIPDFVSLLIVRKMQWTTIFHHICVCAFNYANVSNDYSEDNVCRMIVVYAIFSIFAYSVNMLLASRFLGFGKKIRKLLSGCALVVYVSCCAINWSWQVYYWQHLWRKDPHWSLIAYASAIVPVVYDDLYLNRWLLFNFNRLSAEIKNGSQPNSPSQQAAKKTD